jgi:hypothetical protein
MSSLKLFMSYSWTTPKHEAWVLGLATALVRSGVDVILDKWDLLPGHDAHAFMEQMVTNPEIGKVILVCDKAYVEKANGRRSGAGIEAQIVSGEIYARTDQSKFVAVIAERDKNGIPCVPAYYKSRIYIDMSDPDTYDDGFERLLCWIYDEPLYVKPEQGNKPPLPTRNEKQGSVGKAANAGSATDPTKNERQPAQTMAVNIQGSTVYLENVTQENKRGGPVDQTIGKNITNGTVIIKNVKQEA